MVISFFVATSDMPFTIPSDLQESDFVYVVMYRLKPMSEEEKKNWIKQWVVIRKELPKDIKIVTECGSAFGTDFTGFTVFEGPFSKFEELVDILEENTKNLIEKTLTIIGTKGLVAPSSMLERIMKERPID